MGVFELYVDISDKLWYALIYRKNGDKEIMVIAPGSGRSARPLSYYSSIVKNIGDVKQIRIYVWPQDRARAEVALR